MATATEATEEVQAEPNPYNKKKKWDNSNPEASRGFQSADDSLAYVAEKREAVISSGAPILGKAEEAEIMREAAQETTNDSIPEETNEKFKKVDFKKRYDDLKKHYDRKLGDWKSKEQSLKAEMLAGRTTYTAPKTPEELATFKEDYPDVYDVVETVAHLRATEQLSGLQEEVARLSEKESSSNRRAAEQELLNVHPDFRTIRDSEDFHDWARVQPEAIQDWVYKNTGDASLAGRAIELYKLDAGISSSNTEAKPKIKSSKDSRGSAADAVSVKSKVQDPSPQEKIWTTSEIANLSVDQYEKVQAQVDEAFTAGRVVNG
jgi:uncharacterized protein YutD